MEKVEDEESMYTNLLKQPADNDDKPSSGSGSQRLKLPAKENVQVVNVESTSTSNINPDVVIEVEGTEEAGERGNVTIEIENPYPDLEVQIVVRNQKNGVLQLNSKFLLTVLFDLFQETKTRMTTSVYKGSRNVA